MFEGIAKLINIKYKCLLKAFTLLDFVHIRDTSQTRDLYKCKKERIRNLVD